MAVLTNFLKLLKPEKNDYVDVDKHISENYDKIDSKMQELDKKASKTELGRVKIGDNLTITEDGVLSGNPEYTHPTQAGYKHIPAGGTVGQVLKNNGNGSAEWGNLSLENYYTKPEIDTKFKNYPVPVGGVLMMYNTSNPAEIYPNTTWELLANDKYLKTTTGTPLSTGGSNSFTIQKANLPAVKVQLDSFSLTRGTMNITGAISSSGTGASFESPSGAFYGNSKSYGVTAYGSYYNLIKRLEFSANRNWTGSTGTATPYTQNLGSGTAITVNPTYITIRAWKRLS